MPGESKSADVVSAYQDTTRETVAVTKPIILSDTLSVRGEFSGASIGGDDLGWSR